MAALSEEFTLCGLINGTGSCRTEGLRGLEAGGEADRVLVTDTGRTVTLYKVSDQKPLGSWAVKQGQQITCPAIVNHETGEYVVVHDDKVLRIWKEDVTNLEKVFKSTLSADVHRIHTLPHTDPLVLFRGGAAHFLDSLLADPQQEIETILSKEESILWSQVFSDASESVLVFTTHKVTDYYVHILRFSPNVVWKYQLKPHSEGTTLLGFSGSLKSKTFTLLCLYSSGHICQASVTLSQSNGDTESVLSMTSLLQLPEPTDVGALTVLDDSHIAVLAPSSSKQKDCLCIWNSKFQTLQAEREFPLQTSAQLWCSDGKLFVPHGKSLVVIPYFCEESCLASALGKSQNVQTSVLDNVPLVNWDALLGKEPEAKPTNTNSRKSARQRKTQETAGNGAGSASLITDIQNSAQSEIHSIVQRALLGADSPDFQVTVTRITQRLVNRCKADPKFYPQRSLIQLVLTNRLSYSLCPDLVALALEKQDVCLLQLFLQHFPDVPESFICSCLKSFLSVSDENLKGCKLDTKSVTCYIDVGDFTSQSEDAEQPGEVSVVQNGFSPTALEEDSCDVQMADRPPERTETLTSPVSLKRATLLNSVLTSLYSETFLLPHLKDLSSAQVILFLRYLHFLYVKSSHNVTVNLPGKDVPSISQIMDWMSLVLDAHFTVMVLLPEAKKLLYKLHKFVRTQMRFYSELNKIEGSLSELQESRRQNRDYGRYSIEILELF
ncbi:nucleolar protein 11 [Rhinophrynus dorsalis]